MPPAAVVSETVKRQILERQQRMAAAEEAPEMSKPQTAALQRDIAAVLLPGETVTKALQRLGKQDKRPAGVQSVARPITADQCDVSPCILTMHIITSLCIALHRLRPYLLLSGLN